MKNVENLLVTASEECAEIQQYISKALRFGLDNHHPDDKITNADNILSEFYQLCAIIEHLQSIKQLPTWDNKIVEEVKKLKMENIIKWQKVSKECGLLGKEQKNIKHVQIAIDNYDIKQNPKVKEKYPTLYKEVVEHDRVSTSSWYDLSYKACKEYNEYIKDESIGYVE